MTTNSAILIVESDPRDALRLGYAFARAGRTAPIEIATGYRDAVAQLEGMDGYTDHALFPTPGLLVVDLDQRAGFEVLEWVRTSRNLRELPSVVLTSSGQAREIERAQALGVLATHVKTASIADLCAIARKIEELWLRLQTSR